MAVLVGSGLCYQTKGLLGSSSREGKKGGVDGKVPEMVATAAGMSTMMIK